MSLYKKQENQKLIAIVIVLLMLISIGYAALTTTLTINGTANIGQTSWLVYFTNVVPNANNNVVQVVTEPTTTGKTTTTLNWAVNMDTPGQRYEFTVDAVNEGSIDAMIGAETENLITQGLSTAQKKYLDYTVTYINGVAVEKNDKLAAGETKTLKVRLEFKEDVNAADLPTDAQTINLSYSMNYVQADDSAVEKFTKIPLGIGETVNYSTTLNGVTLNNWKVFYVDGDYTYIILDDYLPNSAIDTSKTNFSKLRKDGDYSIYANENEIGTDLERRTYLLNALSEKSNWDELLTGTLNGTAINETRSEYVFAMGAPDVELVKNSWNTTYPSDIIYIKYADNLEENGVIFDGWYVGLYKNPTSTYVSLKGKTGYNNALYFPHKEALDSNKCTGYWFSSPSAGACSYIMRMLYVGGIGNLTENYTGMAARPVICLPTRLINQ